MDQGTIYTPAVAAGGTTFAIQAQADTLSGTLLGSAVTLTGDGVIQSVRGTLNAPLSGISTGADSESTFIRRTRTGTDQDIQTAFSYTVANPNNELAWLTAGDFNRNWTIAATSRYQSFGWDGVTSTATESTAQVLIPIAGTLTHFMCRYILVASDGLIAVRINEADTVLSLTLPASPGAGSFQQDVTNNLAVGVGSRLNLRFVRTSGTATTFAAHIMLGFRKTT